MSSACTTMAMIDAAEAVVDGSDYSQSLEWDLESWLDDYDRDFEAAAGAAGGALMSRIVVGVVLIIAAAALQVAASARAAGLSMRQALERGTGGHRQAPEQSDD